MTIAVDLGRKATKTNKQTKTKVLSVFSYPSIKIFVDFDSNTKMKVFSFITSREEVKDQKSINREYKVSVF